MVETCVGPSELHLKKELTALQRSRFLRDPETCSSWRSPLSSKSFVEDFSLIYGNGIKRNIIGQSNCAASLEVPSRNEMKRKKVRLYNWKNDSSKSSDSGIILHHDNRQLSLEGSPEDSLSNPPDVDSKSDIYADIPVNIYDVTSTNSETPRERTIKKSRRSSISKKGVFKHSAVSKILDSIEKFDDTENNSEDLQQLTHELACKTGYFSRSASPLLSGSGCANWSNSSKILRYTKRGGSSHSYTPASTSSYYRCGTRNPSIVGSCDGSSGSFDEDELPHQDLTSRQGCGIPCYRPKKTKDRGCGGFYSPSLSDTLRRKGSSILCGSQSLYSRKRLSGSHRQKYFSKSSQGMPLLTNGHDCGGSPIETTSDELSTNFGELDFEALSRLDGRRWSVCKSQEGLEVARPGETELDIPDQRSLSQKYRPRAFDEIIGQTIVVQSLSNAILRGRIAPAYLFQGPRGTGKTSIARIFAAALNCLSTKESNPCGFCGECTAFFSGNGTNLREIDASNKKGIDRVKYLVRHKSVAKTFSRYRVFAIDECHMLSSKMWSEFMKFLEEPPPRVVFIFMTIDPDNLPRAVVSRCQKYIFSKIKDADIVCRLRKLSAEDHLDVELAALDLIALNSDGSLRDAETMLDQLSLLGKRITTSLVNDLVGVVSDEKLLDLLEIAMSSDTAETIKRSRELMDSGVDPMAMMSQLAGLIMDIIAGTYRLANSQNSVTALCRRSLTETELERLQQALKILSDAEKQLRLSSERSTWFTAALLQLGSGQNLEPNRSSSSIQSAKIIDASASDMVKDTISCEKSNSALIPRVTSEHSSPQGFPSSVAVAMSDNFSCGLLPANNGSGDRSFSDFTHANDATNESVLRSLSTEKLEEIWRRCIARCHSKTLRQLLSAHGKLVSITEMEGILIAFVAFEDGNVKSRAERFLRSITNSIEIVLRHNVEVRIGLVPKTYGKVLKLQPVSSASNQTEDNEYFDKMRKVGSDDLSGSSSKDGVKSSSNLPRKSLDCYEGMLQKTVEKCDGSLVVDRGFQEARISMLSSEGNNGILDTKKGQEDLIRMTCTEATDEQRLESAWLQAAEKRTAGLARHPKPEKNQVLPQNGVSSQNQNQSSKALAISSTHWEDELNHDIKALKISGTQGYNNEQIGGMINHYAISPSLLHSSNYAAKFDKENVGYESGPGCNGLFCWKTQKPYSEKVKQGSHVRSKKSGRLSLFGQCGKKRAGESRFRK